MTPTRSLILWLLVVLSGSNLAVAEAGPPVASAQLQIQDVKKATEHLSAASERAVRTEGFVDPVREPAHGPGTCC